MCISGNLLPCFQPEPIVAHRPLPRPMPVTHETGRYMHEKWLAKCENIRVETRQAADNWAAECRKTETKMREYDRYSSMPKTEFKLTKQTCAECGSEFEGLLISSKCSSCSIKKTSKYIASFEVEKTSLADITGFEIMTPAYEPKFYRYHKDTQKLIDEILLK